MVKHTLDNRHQNSEGEMSTLLFQLDKLQSCTGVAKCIILLEGLDIQGNHGLFALQLMQLLWWADAKERPHISVKTSNLAWPFVTG